MRAIQCTFTTLSNKDVRLHASAVFTIHRPLRSILLIQVIRRGTSDASVTGNLGYSGLVRVE